MGKIAFVFAGQGAQYPGMGQELAQCSPAAAEIFAKLDALRPGTSAQCFGGTDEELKETKNTQPCMFAVELAAAAALEEGGLRADMAAGFSLGEIGALTYTRAVDLETGFHLVCRRGELMQAAAEEQPTAMAAVLKLSNEEVRVRVIHCAVGAINESDAMLASTSNAIIVGFNVRPDANAKDYAARMKVDMRMYRVIYDCINEMEAAMKGMLAPKFREVALGAAEVREVYKITGAGIIAGCYITEGKVQRNAQVRLVRDGIVIHEGVLSSLQRFKDAVKEVAQGYECGIGIEKYSDIKVGDIIEAFVMEQIEV